MNTVYDTTVVAYANGDLAGRRKGNTMDHRLCKLEEFIEGTRVAWYNSALLREYDQKIRERRNDVIEVFLTCLADKGRMVDRNVLSRQDYSRARDAGWPTHDQHLLAAGLAAGKDAIVLVTEAVLAVCRKKIRRTFEIHVERI
jgi:hypothetical protein